MKLTLHYASDKLHTWQASIESRVQDARAVKGFDKGGTVTSRHQRLFRHRTGGG